MYIERYRHIYLYVHVCIHVYKRVYIHGKIFENDSSKKYIAKDIFGGL